MGLNEDLEVIDHGIRQLQIEWDKFFGGMEKKPPNELRAKVEALIRRHANADIRNNADRFRFQSLSSRYTSLNELWAKRLRYREEGKVFGMHGLKAERMAPAAPPPPPRPAGRAAAGSGSGSGEIRLKSGASDPALVRSLYDGFLAAREKAGETAPVKFESFEKLISQQASRIFSDKGAQAVDFRLETKDGKVSLKAKVVK